VHRALLICFASGFFPLFLCRRRSVLDLARGDVDRQLGGLDQVLGALAWLFIPYVPVSPLFEPSLGSACDPAPSLFLSFKAGDVLLLATGIDGDHVPFMTYLEGLWIKGNGGRVFGHRANMHRIP
jgi:hypothetical protein